MKVRDRFSGDEYDWLVRGDWPAEIVGEVTYPYPEDPSTWLTTVALTSPSGDAVTMDLSDDAVILRDAEGRYTATSALLLIDPAGQFEEVTLDG